MNLRREGEGRGGGRRERREERRGRGREGEGAKEGRTVHHILFSLCLLFKLLIMIIMQGGGAVLEYHGNSYIRALLDLFPDLQLQKDKFKFYFYTYSTTLI